MWKLPLLFLSLAAAQADAVWLYNTETTYTPAAMVANVSTRAKANAVCTSDPQFTVSKCTRAFAVLGGFPGEASLNSCVIPGTTTALNCSSPIYSAVQTGTVVSQNWTAFIGGPTLVTLKSAGVTGSANYNVFYTGFAYGGAQTSQFSCDSWTVATAAYTVYFGDAHVTDWLNNPASGVSFPCDGTGYEPSQPLLCACAAAPAPTPAPSHAPSANPSRAPSRAPSASPTINLNLPSITVFPSSGTHSGNIGSRAAANQACSSPPAGKCTVTWALLGFSSDSISNYATANQIPGTKLPLNTSALVVDQYGNAVAPSWTQFVHQPNATAFPSRYWWGIEGDGTFDEYYNCYDWTYGVFGNTAGLAWSAGATINNGCNDQNLLVCACVSNPKLGTLSPTGGPTRAPIIKPSVSPTALPTTASPTLSASPTSKSPTVPTSSPTVVVVSKSPTFSASPTLSTSGAAPRLSVSLFTLFTLAVCFFL